MNGIGAARLLPVVFALILGLLGMHALVTVDAGHGMPAPVAAMPQPGPPMAAVMGGPGQPAGAGDLLAEVDSAAAGHQESVAAVVPAMPADHPGMHRALHLCLAVLAGLVILLVGLARMWAPASPDEATRSNRGRGRRAPPRRPPPTSLRLAQLCVMRN